MVSSNLGVWQRAKEGERESEMICVLNKLVTVQITSINTKTTEWLDGIY